MDTAVRETQEEIGISPESLELIGQLRPVAISVSRFQVFPFVATCPVTPPMTPNVGEVSRIVEMPISALIQFGDLCASPLPDRNTTYAIPLPEGTVWGATARILLQLATVLRKSMSKTDNAG
jgi:8-oxo-dGTP pyrophosphatase MutT (NUDIX family)